MMASFDENEPQFMDAVDFQNTISGLQLLIQGAVGPDNRNAESSDTFAREPSNKSETISSLGTLGARKSTLST